MIGFSVLVFQNKQQYFSVAYLFTITMSCMRISHHSSLYLFDFFLINITFLLQARVDRQHRENEAGLTSVKNTIVDLEARMCNGVYLWRITNYPRHRENARENVVTALHSPPFYTSFYGYKLCLRYI